MSDYRPDKWVIVKITSDKYPPVHKVLPVGMVDILALILGN